MASNQQIAPAQQKPIQTLRTMLDKSKEQIALALPKHITADRMMRVAITAVQKQPKLLECSPLSIVGAVIEASQLGLEPDGILGQAYLVPFWNGKTRQMEAQLQPGYRGLIALARRSGEVSTLFSELVYEKDTFKAIKGSSPKLVHEPNYFAEDRGDLLGAYAVVVYKDGSNDWEFMPMVDLNKIRASSKAKDKEGNEYGPWVTHPEQMYLKVPIRRLAKRLPLSPEFQRAAILDEYVDAGVAGSMADSVDVSSEAARMATEHKLDEIKNRYLPQAPEDESQETGHSDPTSALTGEARPSAQTEQAHRAPRRRGQASQPSAEELLGQPLSFDGQPHGSEQDE